MRIGIVGSGKVGGTLTRRFRELGFDVNVSNSRGPKSLESFAQDTGARATTVADTPRDADVVMVAVPFGAVPSLPAQAFDGKIVVDVCNYNPALDGSIESLDDRAISSSRWFADQMPGAHVVKALNNIMASHMGTLGKPEGEQGRIGLPVASDDRDAKHVVEDLVDMLGFDPVDAGTLDESWRQQPGTAVWLTDGDAGAVRSGLANARAS